MSATPNEPGLIPNFGILSRNASNVWGQHIYDAARREAFFARFTVTERPHTHQTVTLSLPHGAVCSPLYIPESPAHAPIRGELRIGENTYVLSISTQSYDYDHRTSVVCTCADYRHQITVNMHPGTLAGNPQMVERILTRLVSEVVRYLSNRTSSSSSDILINSITDDYVEHLENSEKYSKLIKDGSIKYSDFHDWICEEFPVHILKQQIDLLFDEAVNAGQTPVSLTAPYSLVRHISIPMSCGLRVLGIPGDLTLPNILDNLKVNTREQDYGTDSFRYNLDGSVTVRTDPGF